MSYSKDRCTKADWREIDAARARLAAIKLKVQPYPDYDGISEPEPPPRPLPPNAFEQVKAELIFLRNKVAELQEKKKKTGINYEVNDA